MSASPPGTGPRVVALCGGVGGARLADGLAAALTADALTLIVNTGDDFEHWGLRVAPDLDTVMYTLAGLAPVERGWGLEGETFHAHAAMARLGAPAWFHLGDTDLATHLVRTEALRQGATLSEVTERLRRALGVAVRLLPMADGPRPTTVLSEGRTLSFQDWLVLERGAPPVDALRFGGSPDPAPGVLDALEAADLVVLAPSNPYVSIDPILALSGVQAALERRPVVAVSPIVSGRAVKGPLAEMIPRLASEPASAGAIRRHYGPLLDAVVVEAGDEGQVTDLPVLGTRTVMGDRSDRARLARELLAFATRTVCRW
ncbi:MAG: 2-phospho-L-lactate transferase [Deltaproteobacteria bacterium]|nr:2-phospho-L-lactate transferase [Deltaproteobacteria bacterium]MCB9786094.1 2-phospho-L-lactate transferase [Deltaproteobacteria bacterium]